MGAHRHRRFHQGLWWWIIAAVPGAFVGLFFLWPVATMMARGIMTPEGVDLAGLVEVWTSGRTRTVIATTAMLALMGTAGSIMLGVPLAYALFRLRWRGASVARALVTVPFVLPTVVVGAAFTALLGRRGLLGSWGLDQSVAAIVAALVFYNVAVVVRIVGSRWASMDPRLVAAARTLGASRWRAWRSVTLPLLAPAIASAAAVVFLFCATSFGVVLVLGGTRVRTLETEMYLQVNQFLDVQAAAALAVVQMVFVGITLAVAGWARRHRERGPAWRADGSRPIRRADVPVVVAIMVGGGAFLIAPMVALVERSLRTADGWGVRHYQALAEEPDRIVLPVSIAHAAGNSLVTAAVAAVIATSLGVMVAHLLTSRRRAGTVLDTVIMLPLGVSAVIVGLGMLLTMNRQVLGVDLRGSWWLVPLAQAVVALPLVVRTLVPAARAIDPRLRHAAATLGARPLEVWRDVDWPLLKRPVGLALGFAAAISLGEFGATSFLARPDAPTLPTAIYRLLGRPGIDNVGMAFAAAVVLAALTAGIMIMAERLRTQVGAEI